MKEAPTLAIFFELATKKVVAVHIGSLASVYGAMPAKGLGCILMGETNAKNMDIVLKSLGLSR